MGTAFVIAKDHSHALADSASLIFCPALRRACASLDCIRATSPASAPAT